MGREAGRKGLDERGLQFVTTLLFITYRCEYLLKIVHIHLSVCKKKSEKNPEWLKQSLRLIHVIIIYTILVKVCTR